MPAGQIAVQRMPNGAPSMAAALVRLRQTSARMSLATSAAIRSDVARPTPDPPPMTTVDLPSSSILTLLLVGRFRFAVPPPATAPLHLPLVLDRRSRA